MKLRLPFIFCLSFILSAFSWAQDDIENEYAYGTITNITDKEILLKEYNYEKEEFVEITYQILPETKVRNTDSIKSIVNGNQIEILYQDVDGKKNALVVVLETEEGVVEVDNPEKAAAEAPAGETTPPSATPTTAPAATPETGSAPSAATPAASESAAPASAPAPDTTTQTAPAAQTTAAPAETPAAPESAAAQDQEAPVSATTTGETTSAETPAEEAPAAAEYNQ